ncbi:MAG TPA: putative sulfate exporter family transporter [Casimicrobiaceae bacterium]|nr:putative sulfate exporter family transporter [Casimicrobiaceae bacterium]
MTATLAVTAWKRRFGDGWPGLLLSAVIAIAAAFISDSRGGPTLLYALLLGMSLNTVVGDGVAKAGVDFAARQVLRVGVALLGARITVEQIAGLGWRSGAIIVAGVALTIALGVAAAKPLGLSRRLGVLTGGATAICGASAAMAIASVLPRDERSERELVFTVAGITLLSTVAMIAYPVVVKLLGLEAEHAGLFLGATIHDVAQVVGAGYSVSPEVGDFAVVSKLARVAMLLPVVTLVALAVRHRMPRAAEQNRARLLPGFLVAFVVFVAAATLGVIPRPVGAALNDIARACLVVAIAAVGLKTSPLELKRVGARAALLLGVETLFLASFVVIADRIAR